MINKILSFNKVVMVMIIVEFFLEGALATIAPFFAIFIVKEGGQIIDGDVASVGFAIAIYWIVKSIFQLPVAQFLDKTDGETDEFWALFLGYVVASFVPLIYAFSTKIWHIYAAQAIFGFAMAWAVPAFYSIFTRHVDQFKISFEWSLYSVISAGISSSIAAILGGLLIDRYGFGFVFVAASAVIFLSAMGVLLIKDELLPKAEKPKANI